VSVSDSGGEAVAVSLVLATHNEHKRREFARLVAGGAMADADADADATRRVDVQALPDSVVLPPEDGTTFAENALGKARATAAATGRVSIADDSGIEAEALHGAPGVRSARYAGERASDGENLQKLMREAPAGSSLRYVCAIAYVDPASGAERVFEGFCTGRMAAQARGERGFGYDPVFLPDDDDSDLTMAELSDERKDAISHRARALRALLRWLTAG
jgi:XTP/dITP diphosphohydrolase